MPAKPQSPLNVLVIHETEYRDKMIYEWQFVPEYLASHGHKVFVIEYPAIWKRKSPTDLAQLKPNIIKNVRRTNQKRGITLIQPGFIKIPVLSRLSAWLYYWWLIPWSIKKYKISHILLYGVATNGLQTVFWSKMLGVPTHFRCLDVTHEIVPHPLLKYPALLAETIVYRAVDTISAISPMMVTYAKQLSGRNTDIIYIPAGSDSSLFYPQAKDKALLKKYNLKASDYILIFAGTFYHFSGLDQVIKAFPHWLKTFPNLKLLLVGRGEQEEKLKTLVNHLNLNKQVIFTGYIQYEILPKYINLADIGINPFLSNPVTDRIFPGKMYQYVACGLPSISSRLPGVMDIFPPHTTKHGLYYYSDMPGFLKLLVTLKGHVVEKDPNPSLQAISRSIESKLRDL